MDTWCVMAMESNKWKSTNEGSVILITKQGCSNGPADTVARSWSSQRGLPREENGCIISTIVSIWGPNNFSVRGAKKSSLRCCNQEVELKHQPSSSVSVQPLQINMKSLHSGRKTCLLISSFLGFSSRAIKDEF